MARRESRRRNDSRGHSPIGRLSYPAKTRSIRLYTCKLANASLLPLFDAGFPGTQVGWRIANNFYTLVWIPLVIFMRSVNASWKRGKVLPRVCVCVCVSFRHVPRRGGGFYTGVRNALRGESSNTVESDCLVSGDQNGCRDPTDRSSFALSFYCRAYSIFVRCANASRRVVVFFFFDSKEK